jgi:hypothetical protein
MEQPRAGETTATKGSAAATTTVPLATPITPNRFVAYVFDDVHGDATDLMRIRDAAGRNMETRQLPTGLRSSRHRSGKP